MVYVAGLVALSLDPSDDHFSRSVIEPLIVGISPQAPVDGGAVDSSGDTEKTDDACECGWVFESLSCCVQGDIPQERGFRHDRGDVVAVYDGLRSSNCPASKTTPAPVLRALADKAEQQRDR